MIDRVQLVDVRYGIFYLEHKLIWRCSRAGTNATHGSRKDPHLAKVKKVK